MFRGYDKFFEPSFVPENFTASNVTDEVINWVLIYFRMVGDNCEKIRGFKYQNYTEVWEQNPQTYAKVHHDELQDLDVYRDKIQMFLNLISDIQQESSNVIEQIYYIDPTDLIKEINSRALQFNQNLIQSLLQSAI